MRLRHIRPRSVDWYDTTLEQGKASGHQWNPAAETRLTRMGESEPGPKADVAAAVARFGRGAAAGARGLVARQAGSADTPAASFVLGVSESRLGNGRRALTLLTSFVGSGAPSLPGASSQESEMML